MDIHITCLLPRDQSITYIRTYFSTNVSKTQSCNKTHPTTPACLTHCLFGPMESFIYSLFVAMEMWL